VVAVPRFQAIFVVAALGSAGVVGVVDVEPAAAGGSTDWKQVDAGESHTCGVTTEGRLFCWGLDDRGQLGDGTVNPDSPTPVEVIGNATNWAQVAAGSEHTCALKTNGRLFCWGDDDEGQLGDGIAGPDNPVPVQVTGNATNWAEVSAGEFHTCARKTSGRVFCWGVDSEGQLGDGTVGSPFEQPTPVQVAGNATSWASLAKVATQSNHICARKTNGRLFCWGEDDDGRLGDGTIGLPAESAVPVKVTGNATNWKRVTGGRVHTCALKRNGRIFCWGRDDSGQLGDGIVGPNTAIPVQVIGNATDWKSVAAGDDHTCARTTSGRLFCWGLDNNGQLGDGTIADPAPNPAPVEVVSHP
jgi:alpha-tubulin suppressor-like RCC1 family protein